MNRTSRLINYALSGLFVYHLTEISHGTAHWPVMTGVMAVVSIVAVAVVELVARDF